MKTNYNILMKEIINSLENRPKLLLHSCCGPCSSHVISLLDNYFDITVFYYNPNIEPHEEYLKRKEEQKKFIKMYNEKGHDVKFLDCDYANEDYENIVVGLENEPEGGKRCHVCYRLRLLKTAQVAKENNMDYFATTLTVSPYKNAQVINPIGKEIESEKNIKFLYSDFKKEDGYLNSVKLAKEYELYRQDYCGCHYSFHDKEENDE